MNISTSQSLTERSEASFEKWPLEKKVLLRDHLRMQLGKSVWIPHTPTVKQSQFLELTGREAFYGGSAGGGKSDALLMAALQYVDVPGYAALLFRRTYADLALPGALMDRAHDWLQGTAARWNGQEKTWTFPSGATLTFGYLEHENDKYRYQGAEAQLIAFDELTQFDESQYLYLFSRLRRLVGVDIPLRMRSASNPGGIGHDWVKARFVDAEDEKRVYVPARLTDNPHIDQAGYIESLNELDPVTLAQLLNGDWDVQPTGNVFPREAVSFVDVAPLNAWRIRYWDKAGTAGGTGARTAGVRMSMTPEGVVYVEDSVTGRWEAFGRERMLRQVAELDRAAYGQVPVWVEQEPGSGGKESAESTIRNLRGFDVHAERPTGDKLVRARPFAAQWQAGNVRIVRGPWVSDYLNELAAFPLGVYKDQVDASSGAYNKLVGLGEHYWQFEEYEEDVAIGPRI